MCQRHFGVWRWVLTFHRHQGVLKRVKKLTRENATDRSLRCSRAYNFPLFSLEYLSLARRLCNDELPSKLRLDSYLICAGKEITGLQIHHFNIMHLVSLPPKFCLTIVFDFFWDDCNTHKKLETMEMQNFGGRKLVS